MKRITVLGMLLTGSVLSIVVAASQQPPGGGGQQAAKVIEVEKIKDNLFVLRGGGGNTAVFIGSNGVVLVDTKNPGWGQPILDKLKELTSKPVTTIINTHTHFDHVSGNVEFPATVEVVTHENTKSNMDRMGPITGNAPEIYNPTTGAQQQADPNFFKAHNGKGLPRRTFKDKMSLFSGNDRVDLYYFGRGHTNGDAWIVFPALRAMHAGDIFSGGKGIPLLDAANGGSGVAISDTLAKAANTITNVDTVIPGHGPLRTVNDVREYADFNREFLMTVREAKKAGKSVDEVANSWKMPAKYAGYTAPQPARLKANVQVIFDELK